MVVWALALIACLAQGEGVAKTAPGPSASALGSASEDLGELVSCGNALINRRFHEEKFSSVSENMIGVVEPGQGKSSSGQGIYRLHSSGIEFYPVPPKQVELRDPVIMQDPSDGNKYSVYIVTPYGQKVVGVGAGGGREDQRLSPARGTPANQEEGRFVKLYSTAIENIPEKILIRVTV